MCGWTPTLRTSSSISKDTAVQHWRTCQGTRPPSQTARDARRRVALSGMLSPKARQAKAAAAIISYHRIVKGLRGKNWVAAAGKPLEDTPFISSSIHAETPRVTRTCRCSKCGVLLPCKSTGVRCARLAHQESQSASGLSRLVARRLPMQSTSNASPQSLLTRLLCPLCVPRSSLGGGNAAEKQLDREAAACLSVSVTCLAKSRL